MAKLKAVKYNYSGIKFTIKTRPESGKLYIDFYFEGKRIRRSTDILASKEGIIEVKRTLIPDIPASLLDNVVPPYEEKEWTLDELAQEYFVLQAPTIRKHTLKRNKAHYQNHVFPYFGTRLIDTIKPIELERWQNDLLQRYKPATVQKFRSILFSILEKAVDNEIIGKNPLKRVMAPKLMKNRLDDEERKVNPFTEEEMRRILAYANPYKRNNYMRNIILLMYASGMRPGEIVALCWSDIDFERKTIRVTKIRIRNEDGATKTKASNRCIDMLPLAEKALRDQYENTKGYEHVFISSRKQPFYSHDVIGVNFKRILNAAGVKARVLYNLRHTFASQLIAKGADIVWVSKMLGNEDVSITLQIYTKFIEEDDEIRLKKIEKMGTVLGTLEDESL